MLTAAVPFSDRWPLIADTLSSAPQFYQTGSQAAAAVFVDLKTPLEKSSSSLGATRDRFPARLSPSQNLHQPHDELPHTFAGNTRRALASAPTLQFRKVKIICLTISTGACSLPRLVGACQKRGQTLSQH
jgi:hypothetical protein